MKFQLTDARWLRIVRSLIAPVVGIVLVVALVQYARGVVDEYQRMATARLAAERRAENAEKQLALMLKAGDRGILVANISDLPPGELRWVPRVRPQEGR